MHKSIKKNFLFLLNLFFIVALVAFLGGCGGSQADSGGDGGGGDTETTVTTLTISASPTTVPSNNSENTTITVTALNASNSVVANATIQMATDTGVLGNTALITDDTGRATVTFETGANPINRTATITATSGTATAMIPIQIVGSTVTITPTSAALNDSGSSAVIFTVTTRDSGNALVSGAQVNLSQTGTGSVTFSPTSGTTASGTLQTEATGVSSGNVTVTASALGVTATASVTVSAVAETFAIDQLMLNSVVLTDGQTANKTSASMKINGDILNVRVWGPTGVDNVTFFTSIGLWNASSNAVEVPVVGNQASANLTSTQTGIAGVQVYNTAVPATSDTLTVTMSSGAAPYRIDLQASPTIVPVSVGSTVGSSTLTATVRDAANNPLPGWPVAFSIVPGTGTSGGETISPVVVVTATALSEGGLSEGQARTSFTSGSMPSGAGGVQIRATVIGTTIETEPIGENNTDSGNDVSIVIGGVAGSIAFGQATRINTDDTSANYVWPMSILVSDSNGNAVQGAEVSLSLWPIAWSTGVACFPDLDGVRCVGDPPICDYGEQYGTFFNEDINENLILDAGEDGRRYFYADNSLSGVAGTKDAQITPQNSYGGSVPAIVTTNVNGVAGFNLTYPKQSALWTVVRIRASTTVQGSETRGEITLRLTALESDVNPCYLGSSPYTY